MHAPPNQLPSQEAVLFDQIGERLPLSALSEPVRTVNSIWRTDASITSARLYHSTSYRRPPQVGQLWDTTGFAVVGHPISSAKDEELADKARQTLVQAERLLLG